MFNLFKNYTDEAKHTETILQYQYSFIDRLGNLYKLRIPRLLNRESADLFRDAAENGMAALVKYEDGYAIGKAAYVGSNILVDGTLDEVSVSFGNGEVMTVKRSDCALFAWNQYRKPILPLIERYCNLLADVDTSLAFNILYSRVCPIPIVDNDVDETAMNRLLDNLFNGVLKVFKRTSFKQRFAPDTAGQQTMQLTMPEASNYIQNLSSIHDELIVRLCLEYGICISNKDKKAQVNNKEIGAFSDYAALCSASVIRQLELFVKECRDNLGLEVSYTTAAFVYTEEDIEAEFEADTMQEAEAPAEEQEGAEDNE